VKINVKAHSGFRKYFAIFGRRNAGKSSLINQLIGREIAIVSDVPGTTTDPVYKAIEFQPIGPVTIVDTAGIDDVGELGQKRIQKAEKALYKADLALLVVAQPWSDFEEKLLNRFIELQVPYLVVLNKSDLQWQQQTEQELQARGLPMITVSALAGEQIAELRQKIIATLPQEEEVPLLADLIDQHQMIVLVTPIDLGAPKGR